MLVPPAGLLSHVFPFPLDAHLEAAKRIRIGTAAAACRAPPRLLLLQWTAGRRGPPSSDSYGDSLGGGGPTQGPASAGAWHLASAFNRGAQGVPSHNEQWALPGASPWGPAGDPGTLRWRGGGGNQRPPGPLGGGHIGIERDGGYYAETVNHMIEECTDAAEGGLPRGGKGPESDPLGLLQEDKEMLLKRGIAGGSGTPGVAGEGVSNLEVYRVSAGHEQAAPGISQPSLDGGRHGGAGGAPQEGGPSGAAPRSSSSAASANVAFGHRPSRYISTAGAPPGGGAPGGPHPPEDECDSWALGEKGPFGQRARLRRHVVIRIHKGIHQILELQVAEVLRLLQAECIDATRSRSCILTYRDCRQAFTDVHPIPSIEIRRHVILVCLPPITCFVLKDTVYLLVTEDLRADELIYQLCRLSQAATPTDFFEHLPLKQQPLQIQHQPQHQQPPPQIQQHQQQHMDSWNSIAQYAVSAAVTGFEGAAPRLQANTNSVPEESKNPQPVQAQATQTPEGAFEGISSAHPQQPPKVPPPPLRGPPGGTSGGHRQSGGDTSGDGRGPLPGGDWEGKGEDILYLESKFSEAQHRTRTKGELLSLLMEDLHALKEPISLYQRKRGCKVLEKTVMQGRHKAEAVGSVASGAVGGASRFRIVERLGFAEESVNPDLEILLEYFDQEIDQFKIRVRHLKGSIEDSERLLTLRLAVMRNSLIKSELAATLLAAGLAVGTSISVWIHMIFTASATLYFIVANSISETLNVAGGRPLGPFKDASQHGTSLKEASVSS
ncbi:cora-like mg2+ transporter domain-containing protein [Cyclospora cayetanensis]|uniref:Cora-like mg2+ transporter domain-containing protein n=1 Tax=Cyclospora cayetanensis TaxID=88456 RepID=A0A1D3CUA5_9EIME|nr:cora-like mg2+ transporter domain-containing protein [Cyclospora cayetanensis]